MLTRDLFAVASLLVRTVVTNLNFLRDLLNDGICDVTVCVYKRNYIFDGHSTGVPLLIEDH